MSTGSTLLLAVLAVIVICTAVSAASRRQGTTWNYYHFDGHGFVAGQPPVGGAYLALRDRSVPVVLTRAATLGEVALPADKGALAGICHIRTSGGKLAKGPGYTPCPRTPIIISSGNTPVATVLSDENGFFVAVLSAGSYRVSNGVFGAEAEVEKGTTVLVPLLAGKRTSD